MAFGYAAALSTASKLYIVLAFLILGILGYTLCEIVDRKYYQSAETNKNNQIDDSPKDNDDSVELELWYFVYYSINNIRRINLYLAC